MRGPRFAARPVDEGFFSSAPLILRDEMEIPLSAAAVWAELTADNTLGWCRILTRVEWTSPRPFGVGTTRTVRSLGGISVLDEHFFRWEEGRRKSFYVVAASAPAFRSLAEDYLVEPVSDGSCRFTWTIAAEPRALARPAGALNRRVLSTLFQDTRAHYGVA